jgi:hypothetical protein
LTTGQWAQRAGMVHVGTSKNTDSRPRALLLLAAHPLAAAPGRGSPLLRASVLRCIAVLRFIQPARRDGWLCSPDRFVDFIPARGHRRPPQHARVCILVVILLASPNPSRAGAPRTASLPARPAHSDPTLRHLGRPDLQHCNPHKRESRPQRRGTNSRYQLAVSPQKHFHSTASSAH